MIQILQKILAVSVKLLRALIIGLRTEQNEEQQNPKKD